VGLVRLTAIVSLGLPDWVDWAMAGEPAGDEPVCPCGENTSNPDGNAGLLAGATIAGSNGSVAANNCRVSKCSTPNLQGVEAEQDRFLGLAIGDASGTFHRPEVD
jgi:hypothetical protein